MKKAPEDWVWIEHTSRNPLVYEEANYARGLQGYAMRASHSLLERDLNSSDYFGSVLEVGAGTGNHFRFVKHAFDSYTMTDIDEDALKVSKSRYADKRISIEREQGTALSYPNDTFDRLIAVHVLEHLPQPHLVLREWTRVVRSGGVISILIPTDPGLAWRLGRNLGPKQRFNKRFGNYDYIMAREHINSCINLVSLINHEFESQKLNWWPFLIPSVDINLFVSINIKISK